MHSREPVTEPFRIRADPADLADLRARLRATRWPDAPADAGWSLGVDLDRPRDLGVVFLHARAVAAAGPVLSLVLCHGWPDSSWRYEKVLPLLTDPGAHGADPADAFDGVVPDRPGFGSPGTRSARCSRATRGHPAPAAGVAGTDGRRRADRRAAPGRALRAVRGDRVVRPRAARVLPPVPRG